MIMADSRIKAKKVVLKGAYQKYQLHVAVVLVDGQGKKLRYCGSVSMPPH